MITILKQGKKYKDFCFAQCPKCECEFKFDDSDIIHQDDDGPNRSGQDYIVCPNLYCKSIIWDWTEKEDFVEDNK